MTVLLYDRTVRVLVGHPTATVIGGDVDAQETTGDMFGVDVKGSKIKNPLRITFNIDKDSTKSSNTSVVKLYNLTRDTSSLFSIKESVIIEAGYKQHTGVLFIGEVQNTKRYFSGNDYVKEVLIQSTTERFDEVFISMTLDNNMTIGKAMDEVIKAAGLARKNLIMENASSVEGFNRI